jgi:hypothetical protein
MLPIEDIIFDILIIDEAQDMTHDYYDFMRKVCKDSNKNTTKQVVLMGDPKQCIFTYKGADPKFLTDGDIYWPEMFMKRLSLTTSYRLTNEIAAIMNNCMTPDTKIKTVKSGPDALYLVKKDGSDSERLDMLTDIIQKYLLSFLPEDILILCPSINMTSVGGAPTLIANLINKLTRLGIDINRPSDDNALTKDPRVASGKISLLSFHQSKGLEAPVTIIFGFDDGYFKYYGRDYNPNECPSPLYVAVSRASHHLILFQQRDKLPFLENIENYTIYYDDTKPEYEIKEYERKNVKISVNKLIKHLSPELTERLTPIIDKLYVEDNDSVCHGDIFNLLPDIIFTGKTYEYISDLIYHGIVSKHEFETTGKSTVLMRIKGLLYKFPSIPSEIINEFVNLLENKQYDRMSYWVKAANIYDAVSHKLIYRLKQINNYDWIDAIDWTTILSTFKSTINNNFKYKNQIGSYNQADNYRSIYHKYDDTVVKLTGSVDAHDTNTVIQFVFSNAISNENKLQLILNSWMLQDCLFDGMVEWKDIKFCIYNIKTGQTISLINYYETIDKVSNILIQNRLD